MFWNFFKKSKNNFHQRSVEEIKKIFNKDFLKLSKLLKLSDDQVLEELLEKYRKKEDKDLEEYLCYYWTENHPYNWKAYYSLACFHLEQNNLDIAAGFFMQAFERGKRTYQFKGEISKEELENLDKNYHELQKIVKEPPVTHCFLAYFTIQLLIESEEYLERTMLEEILKNKEIFESMLIGLIRSPDEPIYGKIFHAPCHAALILTEIKSKKAIPFFINLLDYDGDVLRENISHGLAKLSDDYPEVIDKLFEVILSPDFLWDSKAAAAEILGWTLPKYHHKIEKFILDLFQDKKYWEKAKKMKVSADLADFFIFALRDIRSTKGIEILEKFYQENKEYLDKGIFGGSEFQYGLEDLKKIKDKKFLEFDSDPRKKLEYDIFEILCKKEHLKKDKINRNDPCPCNSGKKYKKCCGR